MRPRRSLQQTVIGALILGLAGIPAGLGAPEAIAEAGTADYLAPELRAQVERLKRDVARNPTTAANADERALLLFDWINAFALNGGYVPVNATAVVAQANAYGVPGGGDLDLFIRELTLHDERPDALGPLVLAPDASFEVRGHATFTQTYTVGSAPIEPGGGFLLAKHFQVSSGPYQTRDPAAANYVSIQSSNPAVTFEPDRIDVAGMHGGFRGEEGQLAFRVRGAALEPGNEVVITYGDTSGGGPGLRMPDFTSDQMPFPIYVNLDGGDLWLSLPIQPLRVHGSSLERVRGFAPSIVTPGERFRISVRAEDRYGNRATGRLPAWEIFDGERRIAQAEGPDAVVSSREISLDSAGVHRLSIRAADGSLVGPVNPILVEQAPAYRLFWGETHGHSGFAEGIGSADAFMRYARDDARLDFVTHSEHDIWMDDREWLTLQEMVRNYSKEGEFIAYLGYEWTVRTGLGGHHNVLFRTPDDRERIPAQRYPTLSRLYQGLREQYDTRDVLIIPHAHQKGDYRQSDPEMEHLVEIMSGHGTFEWFGRMYLSHGHQVGFIAASDDHLGRPGYSQPRSLSIGQRGGLAAVQGTTRTVDGVFDALRGLQTYATTGERMIVDVTVNGTRMGGRAEPAERRTVRGSVHGTAPIRSITLFKNDRTLNEWNFDQPDTGSLLVSFYSESYPYHPQDNPRGWRHWRGTLEVRGAAVESVTGLDFDNLEAQTIERDPVHPNRFRFRTMTRGDSSTISIQLAEPSDAAEVVVRLEEAVETGSGPPTMRRHQRIPGTEASLAVAALQNGQLVAPLPFDGYRDSVTLSYGSKAPLDAEFEYTDAQDPRQGDYYFVRIRQLDESLAWSSPTWVGGSAPR